MLPILGSIYDGKRHQRLLKVDIEKCLWTLVLVKDFENLIDIMKPLLLMSVGEKYKWKIYPINGRRDCIEDISYAWGRSIIDVNREKH